MPKHWIVTVDFRVTAETEADALAAVDELDAAVEDIPAIRSIEAQRPYIDPED